MGSCISKCKPKTSKKQQNQKGEKCLCTKKNYNNSPLVQDKLVITSQVPSSPPHPYLQKSLVSTPTSSKYSPSSPSFSCTKSNNPSSSSSSNESTYSSLSTTSSIASSLSSASSFSILSSKLDRSFSNDFLRSCVKENPHIIRPDFPLKIVNNSKARSALTTRCHTSSSVTKPKGPKHPLASPQGVVRPVLQKRVRCSSPSNLGRQKSFRGEPDMPIVNNSRELRPISPSPSRRFKGEDVTTSMRREANYYVKASSPGRVNSRRYGSSNSRRIVGHSNNLLGKRESEVVKKVESKIEELSIGNLLISGQDVDMLPIEDANNPHIALDCFIFL